MKHPHPALQVLAAVCLLLVSACQDKHEPTRPTTGTVAVR